MCSFCRLPVAIKPQLLANFDFLRAPVPTPFTDEDQIWCAVVYAYLPNFVSIGLFCRPLFAKNPNFGRFWTSTFSVVANWQQSEKDEHGGNNYKPSPTQRHKNLYSNAFMAKSDAQSLTFKSVTNKQTYKQTKETQRFGHLGGG